MNSAEFLKSLLSALPDDCLLVSALGRTSEELYQLAPERTLFLDAMGDVAAVATGLALAAEPMPVAAVDTDGSFLMNLSVLTMLGHRLPRTGNLQLIVLDNGNYESAGGLASRQVTLSWPALFGSVGLNARLIKAPAEVPAVLPEAGSVLVGLVRNGDPAPGATKPCDGVETSYRIERRIADWHGRPPRIPAVKS